MKVVEWADGGGGEEGGDMSKEPFSQQIWYINLAQLE